jgi:hypothetical protein
VANTDDTGKVLDNTFCSDGSEEFPEFDTRFPKEVNQRCFRAILNALIEREKDSDNANNDS